MSGSMVSGSNFGLRRRMFLGASAALVLPTVSAWLANAQEALDRKSTRQNSSHNTLSRMPSSA